MPPELRKAYTQTKADLERTREELTTLKAAKTDDPEKKVLVDQNQAHQKRIQELEEELKYTSFEKTEEYEKQYNQPFVEAYNQGRTVATELKVTNDDGTQRQGTAEDFEMIMAIGNTSEANTKAVELFGSEASLVMAERRAVILANNRRVKAIQEFKASGAEREKKRVEMTAVQRKQQDEQRQTLNTAFRKLGQEQIEARPEVMKADDTDQPGQQIVKAEEALADLAFGAISPEKMADLPEGVRAKLVDGKLPTEELVKFHAACWAKMRGYGLLYHKFKAIKTELDEAKAALEEYQASTPGVGGARRGKPGEPRQLTPEEEIDAMAAGNA